MTAVAQSGDAARQFARARAPRTAEIIAASIRRQIVTRQLEEGDTLPSEVALMEQFGVSRPTLREAFRILETESLVSVRRGSRGGAQVMAPSLSVAGRYVGLLLQMAGATIGEVYAARALIEPVAVGLLASRCTADDVAALRSIIEELEEVTGAISRGEGNPTTEQSKWARLSWNFHEQLIERAGNRALAIQWGVLRDVTETHMASQIAHNWQKPSVLKTLRRSARSYAKVVSLLEANDVAGAQEHWEAHMDASGDILAGASRTKEVVDLFD